MAGDIEKTASWATNVSNEVGQVLNTVLTVGEGVGLTPMTQGIVKRYHDAAVPPPELLYVDRDCCILQGKPQPLKLFQPWETLIRLDIWHFMRRFSSGMTTDNHPLYGIFLSRLSSCIFEWSSDDLLKLRLAKSAELSAAQRTPTQAEVDKAITKKEMALHCRRKTRGVDKTRQLIQELLDSMWNLTDAIGVRLIDPERMANIWRKELKHIPCIQDPPDVELYTTTGSLRKGGHTLQTYRCARGSVSVESFHLHQNRFIPGKIQISKLKYPVILPNINTRIDLVNGVCFLQSVQYMSSHKYIYYISLRMK